MVRAILGLSALLLPIQVSAQTADTGYTRYDAAGRVTGTISPDPDGPAEPLPYPAVRNTYTPAGELHVVEQGYLTAWQPESVAPASWSSFVSTSRQIHVYDSQSRKTEVRVTSNDASGNEVVRSVTNWSYALDGQVKCTAVRMNASSLTAAMPDACSQQPNAGPEPDRITWNHYDAAGQLTRIERGVGTGLRQDYATYEYNDNGQRKSLTDAREYRAEMKYDGLGRQEYWCFPSKTTIRQTAGGNCSDFEKYEYDQAGNRTAETKRDGSRLQFQYDALNRMRVKTVPERTGLDPIHTRDVYYTYDNRGLQTGARFGSDSGEGVTSSYDGFGRLTASSTTMGGTTRSLAYRYDPGGRRAELTYPDDIKVSFLYDALDRMTGVRKGPIGSTEMLATMTYNATLLRSALVRAGGDRTDWIYTPGLSRPELIKDRFVGPGGNVDTSLGYNPASQITSRGRSNEEYSWTRGRNVTRSYKPNGQNQYDEVSAKPFVHDANGNLTDDAQSVYLYDVENRLVSATRKAGAEGDVAHGQLLYDPLGRLFETKGGTQPTRRFLYDGDELVAEYDDAGVMVHRYVHGAGVDDPLVWYNVKDNAGPFFYHADHQGSLVAIAGPNGEMRTINTYDSWGLPGDTLSGRFAYTGQIYIPELWMYHYKARVYSPALGRFMQTDPIGYEGGQNLYAYADNSPINLVDPSGRNPAAACAIPGVGALCIGAGEAIIQGVLTLGCALLCDDAVEAVIPRPVLNEEKSPEDKRRGSRPTNAPRGTKPINAAGIDKTGVHEIKDGITARPDDWVGITPTGDIVTSDPQTGESVNQGNICDYDIQRGSRDKKDNRERRED